MLLFLGIFTFILLCSELTASANRSLVNFKDCDVSVLYVDSSYKHLVGGFVRKTHLTVDCGSRGPQEVCALLREQVLAAYRFKTVVPKRYWCPELWQDGVRKLSCYHESFFSEDIRKCLEKIDESIEVDTRWTSWRHLSLLAVQKHIYPEGMTRRWRLGFIKEWWELPRRKGYVYIFLAGMRIVLTGTPCAQKPGQDVSEGNILALKQSWNEYPQIDVPRPMLIATEKPTLREFLSCGVLGRRECVGLVYIPHAGEPRSVLLDVSGASVSMAPDDFAQRDSLIFPFLCDKILCGYTLILADSTVNVDLLRKPCVREALCYRNPFCSYGLRVVLENLKRFVLDGPRVLAANGWGGFRAEDCLEGYGTQTTRQWRVVDHDALREAVEKCEPKGAFFIATQGETVALQGRSMPVPRGYVAASEAVPENSLADYLQRAVKNSK